MKSVKSRVTNINDHIKKDISLEDFRNILIKRIAEDNDGEEYIFIDKHIETIEKERYLS